MKGILIFTMVLLSAITISNAANASNINASVSNWRHGVKESNSNYTCPASEVMYGRKHHGDENGKTHYKCIDLEYGFYPVHLGPVVRSGWLTESNSYFKCPPHTAMIGRHHSGDENGPTRYTCAPMLLNNKKLALKHLNWSAWVKESKKDSGFQCTGNQVMVGRHHHGDENGNTKYLCASINWDESVVNPSSTVRVSRVSTHGSPVAQCPDKYILTGRSVSASDAELAITCRKATSDVGAKITVTEGPWRNWDNGSSNASNSFTCTNNQLLIGENYQTFPPRFRCGYIAIDGVIANISEYGWSDWVSSTNSTFNCPSELFMISRQSIKSGSNAFTRYKCAHARLPFHPTTLEVIRDNIEYEVGRPADDGLFASRADMGVGNNFYLHFDIGGEGYHSSDTPYIRSGFASAINFNALTHESQPPGAPIPLLVLLKSFGEKPLYPIHNFTADYLTFQGVPLTAINISAMKNKLKSGGEIGLWVCPNDSAPLSDSAPSPGWTVGDALDSVADYYFTDWTYSCSSNWNSECRIDRPLECDQNCLDEFSGDFGSPKICIKPSF